ncbi:DEAD box RNA helicase isoform B [Chlorella sorokiniana]|uniref:ATP-dependent RNA helicase n=1 Tax=Chlorella sorokiniana TaxID=3076 RepID=A0A2P6TZ61_CHLSO|nr:DEAD box RNA helicase isoform B [Chlorella sorokiniana]|eukprot:PRW59356.1 DEAD box RNA helicase isoform B [Chlorella sorokiniana]
MGFLVPAIEALARAPPRQGDGISVLVLSPTRELASQIEKEAEQLLRFHPFKAQVVYGGTNINSERNRLGGRCDVLVATPGRLIDHLENSGLAQKLQHIRTLVLDEADQLLEMGFRPAIERVLSFLPRDRQTLLFSATMPQAVQQVAGLALKQQHSFIDTIGEEDSATNVQVEQSYALIPMEQQFAAIYNVLRRHAEETPDHKVIVFFTTARLTQYMAALIDAAGLPVLEIHSRKSQSAREKASAQFRTARSAIMFSSDVSARGVDYPDVTLVLQIGVPSSREQYIHRLGRTARAGRTGRGVLLLMPEEQHFLRQLRDLPLAAEPGLPITPQDNAAVQAALGRVSRDHDRLPDMAYAAWLGFYNSAKGMGWDKPTLVQQANRFAGVMGLSEPPALLKKTIGMMGLKGVPGLRIDSGGGFGGGRGGGGGGRGGGQQQQQQQQRQAPVPRAPSNGSFANGGFRASVVRIVDFRKEEYLDRHQPHARPPAGKRPFLLLLSPDTLTLATASDATDGPPVASAVASMLTLKPDRPPAARPSIKPLALLHKLSTVAGELGGAEGGGSEGSGSGGNGGSGRPTAASQARDPAAADSRLLLEDGEPLEEGQLLNFSIALSQVVGVELVDERRIKVLFARQKPHRSTETNDDWKAVMKSMVLPFALPWEGWKHKDWGVNAYLNRHRRDPFVSSVCFEADSPQEAAVLRQAIEEAIARLGAAVAWLSKDLPLNDRPVVTLVTAAVLPPGAAAAAASSYPGSSLRGSSGGGLATLGAGMPDDAEEAIVATFPRLRQPLDVPALQPQPSPAASGGSSGKTALSGKGPAVAAAAAPEAAPAGELAVRVWLHSPLGPAVATISEQQLRQSAEAGGAPVSVVAAPHQEEDQLPLPIGRDKLEVVLQFAASQPVPRSPSRHLYPQSSGAGAAAAAAAAGQPAGGASMLPAMLALLAVPLLAAWLQLILSAGTPAINVLQSVAFLVSSLAAIVGIVVLQLSRARLAMPPVQQAAAAPQQVWRLTLLHADLVSESRRRAGAPPVVRVVSSSSMAALPSAPLPPVEAGAVELSPPIRRLVAEHPAVLTQDVAARFVVGLGPEKAYTGLKNMVDWVEAQGVADLVHQPQPRFEVIKKHYPQVFYAWSKRCDAVLEVECTGRWREAYDALRALGVTDQELLRHQFFTMEYAVKMLDSRPLPHGKTVKIIDLEGLTMRDVGSAAFKWYLQVGGALLAVNYPQRLHKAFLVNAPTWSGVIWKVLAAVIPRRTREQLMLFTRKQRAEAAEALLQWVPAEQLPVKYGGQCATPLGESELELQMAAYVRRLNEQAAAAGAMGPAAAEGEQAAAAARDVAQEAGSAASGIAEALDVQRFAGAREQEIRALVDALKGSRLGAKFGVAALPRHLRRRAGSHKPFHRHAFRPNTKLQGKRRKLDPAAEQGAAAAEQADAAGAAADEQQSGAAARPFTNRRMRRQPALLQQQHRESAAWTEACLAASSEARSGAAVEGSGSGSGTSSSSSLRRLETHVWHAKRLAMEERYGWLLPAGAAGQGRGSRSFVHVAKASALMHDASYLCPLLLSGTWRAVHAVLRLLLDPTEAEALAEDWAASFGSGSSSTGASSGSGSPLVGLQHGAAVQMMLPDPRLCKPVALGSTAAGLLQPTAADEPQQLDMQRLLQAPLPLSESELSRRRQQLRQHMLQLEPSSGSSGWSGQDGDAQGRQPQQQGQQEELEQRGYCPAVLVRHDGPEAETLPGWSLIVPASWVPPFWLAAAFAGCKPAGQREWRWLHTLQGQPCFPWDHPDTAGHAALMEQQRLQRQLALAKRPTAKQMLAAPASPPDWHEHSGSRQDGGEIEAFVRNPGSATLFPVRLRLLLEPRPPL